MRLVLVELRRLFARRFFTVGATALLLGLGAILVVTAMQSSRPSEADWASARAAVVTGTQEAAVERETCRKSQLTNAGDPVYPPEFDCDDIREPTAQSQLENSPFVFVDEIGSRTFGLSAVLMLFAFLVGATAVGAEWQHGTLTGLLLWEPRRIRVFVAKLLALLIGATTVGTAAYAANYGGLWLVARFRGVVGDVTTDAQAVAGLDAARGLALALVAGAMGFAIAFTLRHTAGAIGVALAYFGVLELGVRSFVPSAPKYLPITYVSAWLEKRAHITYPNCLEADCGTSEFLVTMWGGGAYLLGLGLVTLVLAAAVFRRREVA